MTHRSKLAVRILFAVTLIFFAFQLVGNYATRAQPYPALAMPGFPGTPTADGEIDWHLPQVILKMSDGTRRSVGFEQILPTDTGVLPSAVFRARFATDKYLNNPETVAWLQARALRLFPDSNIAGLTIIWQEAKYNINDTGANGPTLEPVDIIEVNFDRAP